MIMPGWIFSAMVVVALVGVAGGALYLLVVLTKEWRRGELW